MTTLELQGIAHELEFWMRFTKEERFLKGWVPSNIVTPELHPKARDILTQCLRPANLGELNSKNILDVGSGVVSLLNGFFGPENLYACDPLASLYQLIFDYKSHGHEPPFTSPAEELTRNFEAGSFDLVHCSNALDHTQDPEKAICEMLEVVESGGHIVIQGFSNEGTHERFKGFHQWNLTMENNILAMQDRRGNLVNSFKGEPDLCLTLPLYSSERYWYIWTLKKL